MGLPACLPGVCVCLRSLSHARPFALRFAYTSHITYIYYALGLLVADTLSRTVDGQSECHANNKNEIAFAYNANGNNNCISRIVCVWCLLAAVGLAFDNCRRSQRAAQTHHHKSIRNSQQMRSPLALAINYTVISMGRFRGHRLRRL